jgi:hypothetical protein
MREARKSLDEDSEASLGKRRLTLTRLLIWAEQEAMDLERVESAEHINRAIGQLFDDPPK